uniref:Uncharacterized protein n=1 Tax=Anguilla anguilla TaxID=7936 RepID=A0A0E9Q769_ANGAN
MSEIEFEKPILCIFQPLPANG